MLRRLLVAFGCFEIARPRTVIDACERIGLENPEAAELRPWAANLARLEGIAVVWLLRRHGRGSRPVALLFGLTGLLAIVAPTPLIRLTQHVAYRNPDELRLRSWIRPAARLLGVCYLVVTAFAWRRDDESDGTEQPESVETSVTTG